MIITNFQLKERSSRKTDILRYFETINEKRSEISKLSTHFTNFRHPSKYFEDFL